MNNGNGRIPPPRARPSLPRGVWMLGIVSLCMDLSSEIIHGLLPVFLVSTLGASVVMLGLIEGVSEAVASLVKLFSGALSDFWGRRKVLVLAGYGLAALVKPLFPLAAGPGMVLAARFLDRCGKGLRGAPRDAMIADIAPPSLRGAAFGLRQALDTVGALLGPLAAAAMMAFFFLDIRTVMWVAVVPAVLAVAVLGFGVREPPRPSDSRPRRLPLRREQLARLGSAFWGVLPIIFGLNLARMSEAFLLLRASRLGLADAAVPLVLAALSLAFALASYPAGRLSDRLGRHKVAAAGIAFFIAACLVLAVSGGVGPVFAAAVLWGLYLAFTQGVLAALVADLVPESLRGAAFGVFHLTIGVAALAANLMAGWLWTAFGAPVLFLAAAAVALVSLLALMAWIRRAATP